jgi:putative ABC transport system substrate-binding protein
LKRRDFIAVLGCAAVWPVAARAQQAQPPRRVGILMPSADTDPEIQAHAKAFREALDSLGWKEGKNIQFEYRWTRGDSTLVGAFAKELVALSPDAILTQSTQLVHALRDETRTIPIVFGSASDPVESKLVASLAKPGGNITGFTSIEAVSNVKYLELLKEFDARITRVGVVISPNNPSSMNRFAGIAAGGPALKVDVIRVDVTTPADIERAIDAFAAKPNGALVVLPGTVTTTHRSTIIDAATRNQLPTIHSYRYYPAAGALMSFGADQVDQFRRAGSYVDRILRGEKPGDLPIQAPTKFDLVINLKAAKALGIDVAPTLLARADEVIE